MVGTIDHPTCGEKWMLVLLTPLALAASAAALAGLVWWSGTLPWRTTLHYREGATWMLICLWPVYAAAFSIAGWVTRPAPDLERDNVTIEDAEPPISNLPPFPDQFRQTREGPFPAWSRQPALPTDVTESELIDWILDARDGRATFAARDSRKGEGGRSRGIEDDVTSNVKNWLEQWGVIDVDGSNQWTWGEMAQPLFDALLRGEGFGVLMDDDLPPTESEV